MFTALAVFIGPHATNPEKVKTRTLADLIASLLLSVGGARQTILQSLDIEERLRHLNRFLTAEIVRAQKDPIE